MPLSIPDFIVNQTWRRCGGHCECRCFPHHHKHGRCAKTLSSSGRGRRNATGWEIVLVNARKGPMKANHCRILCRECCSKTRGHIH